MRIAHIFCHQATNLGDIYLRRGTRDAFRTIFPDARFTDVETRRIFGDEDVAALNDHDLVLIGGGGLLLRDTFPNEVSDWQLGMTARQLEQIRAPLVVHAIGYNRFRGQEDFARPLFDEHISTLLRTSSWFTVRNHGSARALRGYVPGEMADRIRVNPCPSLLFPRAVPDRTLGTDRVGLLLAGDRLPRRHADLPGFGARIRTLMEEISRHAELSVVVHQPHDRWFYEYVDGVDFREIDLIGASPETAVAAFSALDTVIGDRGHAQMIPFALGCRIVSLVSHDKLGWFLDDIDMPDYGVEESDPELVAKVLEKIFPASPAAETYRERRVAAMARLSVTTCETLASIREAVAHAARGPARTPVSPPTAPPASPALPLTPSHEKVA